jgi:C1A family cysteine protease
MLLPFILPLASSSSSSCLHFGPNDQIEDFVAPSLPEVLSFEDFCQHFGKRYDDDVRELERRRSIFDANVETIRMHNQKESSFRMGVNKFTDLTSEEFGEQFARGLRGNGVGVEKNNKRTVTLPEAHGDATIDWRTLGAVTPVKNQAQCGSCWAFSTTGSVEGAYFLATGALRSLSEQQLVDCSTQNKGCSGGIMEEAFKYIEANKGIDSEIDYDYVSGDGSAPACWTEAEKRAVATIDSFVDVPKNNEAQLSAAVLKQPISVAIEADKAVFQHYKSGVMSDGVGCGTALDHGVLVVGLTTDAYIVKNSWGSTWGENGYIRLKRNWNATAVSGICGIASQPTYPVKAKGTAPPLPPRTDNSSRPGPPPACPGCDASKISMCGAFGMKCCCGSNGTTCHPTTDCCCKSGGVC